MKSLFLSTLLLGFFSPVKAEVDSKVAEFCLRAKDFEGCVRSMSSKSSDMPSMRIIEGGVELSGNSCPNDFVYVGAGSCRNYILNTRTRLTIDGVGIWRAGHVSKPRWNYYYKLGEVTKAIYDPKCPDKEPYLYTQNSCAIKPTPPPPEELRRILGLAVIGGGKERIKLWDKKLEQVYGIPNLSINAKNQKKRSIRKDVSTGSVRINCSSSVWKNKPICKGD